MEEQNLHESMQQQISQTNSPKSIQNERQHIYEIFHPWALKTYGDQAKTKTITLRKKVRILKALEGKEHSRPDSSKFRFWVKSKAFTTTRPQEFQDKLENIEKSTLPPNAVLSENPSNVDLFVASTNKHNGKRIYRKVAVVEEFFDIIYNVHMELGGRSGMHAGQKRTYRIITETYAFLPREAVTRFLSTCPECKKNLRPSSPLPSPSPSASGNITEQAYESSSEVEVFNYSSHTESSVEAGPPILKNNNKIRKRRYSITKEPSNQTLDLDLITSTPKRQALLTTTSTATTTTDTTNTTNIQNIKCPDINFLKSQYNLFNYYELLRHYYTVNFFTPPTTISTTSTTTTANNNNLIELPTNTTKIEKNTSFLEHLTTNICKPFNFSSQPTPQQLQQQREEGEKEEKGEEGVQRKEEQTFREVDKMEAMDLEEKPQTSKAQLHKSLKIEGNTSKSTTTTTTTTTTLPTINLDTLKPITTTYLQLTRSMGLSDEDALRFDNLVSEDFKYSL